MEKEKIQSGINPGKTERRINVLFFTFLLAGVMAVTLVLFYRQCVGSMSGSGLYHSDMKAYILKMQGLDSGYQFPYPVLFKLAALFHLFASPELSMALATMFLNSLAVCITKLVMDHLVYEDLKSQLGRLGWGAGPVISLLSVGLFFISMLYPPAGIYLPGIRYNYLGVFTANPFHNATYMAARPFAVLAFYWFVKLLDRYETETFREGNWWKDYLLFSVFLLLATMAKPSFTIVLAGAAGLIMVYRFFLAKGKNLVPTLILGMTFVPTFLDLLYQFRGVFVPKEGVEGGIGFCLGSIWGLYCENLPLSILLAVGFPLLVLLFHRKEFRKDTLYRFSWQLYLMGFAMAFFLYEKGFRAPDFNFSWGYMYGIFFAFLGAVYILMKSPGKNKLVRILQWAAFGAHLLCGLVYFGGIFAGRMYY